MSENMIPAARTTVLVVKEVEHELLVYDLERHRAHSLNTIAAAVWRRCDGRRDARAIVTAIRDAEGTTLPEASVRFAVGELARARLLAGPGPDLGLSRREWLRRFATTGAVAIPVVTSIVAPTAAQAASCSNVSCTTLADCCPGCVACISGSCLCPA